MRATEMAGSTSGGDAGSLTPSVQDLLDDLRAEQIEVQSLVTGLTEAAWLRPTSPGWTVRDQIAHLAYFDVAATRSISAPDAFSVQRQEALADVEAYEHAHLREMPEDGPTTLAAWARAAWRFRQAAERADPRVRLQWFGPDMGLLSVISARLMETWAHGQDVADAFERARTPTARLRHVAGLAVRARAQGYVVRNLPVPEVPVRVELTAPDGETWEFGPEGAADSVRGPAEDFCLVLTRRRQVADTVLVAEGAAAGEWLEIGQAYAGPAGSGPARLVRGGGPR